MTISVFPDGEPLPLTTKGDLLTHDGSVLLRLPVGTDTHHLVADSAEAGGIKWVPAGAVWSVVIETTASRTAAAGEFILVNVATCVVTLPVPVLDDRVAVKVITATPTSIEIRTSGAGIDIDGTDYSASGLVLADQFEQINLTSDGTDWFIY